MNASHVEYVTIPTGIPHLVQPLPAAAAASQAGVEHADRWVDMSQVKDDEIAAAAEQYTVFGRVTPVQKKQLVEAFHRQKRTVAMTGGGVNDLLA